MNNRGSKAESSGRAESLWGKIDPRDMGDRAYRGRPVLQKLKKRKQNVFAEDIQVSKRRKLADESVLNLAEEEEEDVYVYQPKTKETRSAYEALLNVIQKHLGGHPQDVLCGAADEVLGILKNDRLENPDKKKEIEKFLNVIDVNMFDTLLSISRLITDFQDGDDPNVDMRDALDVDIGFGVQFEDDNECDYYDQVQDEEEDEDDGTYVHGGGVMLDANEGMRLYVQDIDECGGDAERRGHAVRDAESGWLKGKRQLIDLENLAFEEGGLYMANKKCELPKGSYSSKHNGYEEVYVPALKPKPLAPGEELKKIVDIPDWAQPAFSGMNQLNRVQSKVYETALLTAENLLLCAPTGAGKTNVAVLTILQQISLNRNPDGSFNNSGYKIVYVAPMKALVAEIVGNLSDRLKYYNVRVKELSGDPMLTRQQIEETQIIVTTPEKWDIVTRKSGERTYTQHVKLLIIDEIHLLHDNRGPVLKSIVARTVRKTETIKEHIRLVGLSATLPNYEDVALFLRVDREKGLFYFGNSYRPCPLAQQYIGISVKKPLQRFQLMNDLCYEKVLHVAGKHQVLIFVHSRKETNKTACAIKDTALAKDTLSRFLKEDSASHEILQSHTEHVKSNDLKNLLPYGFAIHHPGMARVDRQLVEDLFADGHVQVLVSTATLAWGVNLPAHTVIIKGTQTYNPDKGAWTELSPLDVMQMLGRAGRSQFDTYGEGIILTGHNELQYYLSLMNQQLPIESQFVSKLADLLNAEIVLGTVQNAREACSWIGYTYFYVRMLRNATLYGLSPEDLMRDVLLEERWADLIHSAATILDNNNLVKYDRKSGWFQVTDLGRIASYSYITHGTIST